MVPLKISGPAYLIKSDRERGDDIGSNYYLEIPYSAFNSADHSRERIQIPISKERYEELMKQLEDVKKDQLKCVDVKGDLEVIVRPVCINWSDATI